MKRLNEILEEHINAAYPGTWANLRGRASTSTARTAEGDTFMEPENDELITRAREIARAREDVPALVSTLLSVLNLHTPVNNGRATPCCTCEQWIESNDDQACIEWPCPTVETIAEHLEGTV